MNFSTRANEAEIMDDLTCSGEVVGQTLRELEFINAWLGGNQVTLNSLDRLSELTNLKNRVITIADLGCGSGDMLKLIDRWAKKKNITVKLIGIDANPNIISYAKLNCAGHPHIELRALNIFSEEFSLMKFDVVIGTLFFHHFTNEELIRFFSKLKTQVQIGIIVNDIHRHPLAYHSIKILTEMFSKSPMVKSDGPLSVRRAFSKCDLYKIFHKAGFDKLTIKWKWAFRWQVLALTQ